MIKRKLVLESEVTTIMSLNAEDIKILYSINGKQIIRRVLEKEMRKAYD